MWYVKARDGLTAIDPDRRDRLPEGKWRPVPENRYWRHLQQMGDVSLVTDAPPDDEIEGHVATEAASPEAAPPAADAAERAY